MSERDEDVDLQEHARLVGVSFINQYYKMLLSMTDKMGGFYGEESTLCIDATTVCGEAAIQAKFMELEFEKMEIDIFRALFFPCKDAGILVVVTGALTSAGAERKISQTFWLEKAPGDRYVVMNDVLLCVDGPKFGKAVAGVSKEAAQTASSSTDLKSNGASSGKASAPAEETGRKRQGGGGNARKGKKAEVDTGAPASAGRATPNEEVDARASSATETEDAASSPSGGFSYAQMLRKPKTVAASSISKTAPAPAPSSAGSKGAPATSSGMNGKEGGKSKKGEAAARRSPANIAAAIFVKDINKEWGQEKLSECFSVYGKVASVEIPSNKRFAFVNFDSPETVKTVLSVPEINLDGKSLHIEARTQPAPASGSGSGRRNRGGRGPRTGSGGVAGVASNGVSGTSFKDKSSSSRGTRGGSNRNNRK